MRNLFWTSTGSWTGRVFSAFANNTVKMWDCASGQEAVVAKDDFAIKSVRAYDQNNKMLITGRLDHKIRHWDHKNPTGKHLADVNVENKVDYMDLPDAVLVTTSANHVFVFDVRKGDQVMSKLESQLKFQLRVCVCFPDQKGFLLVLLLTGFLYVISTKIQFLIKFSRSSVSVLTTKCTL